jgi:hypothetical protein
MGLILHKAIGCKQAYRAVPINDEYVEIEPPGLHELPEHAELESPI